MVPSSPGRGAAARVIRAPNHLGDLVMALPALLENGGDVVLPEALAPLLAMAGHGGGVIPFRRGLRGWRRAVSALRRRRYREGVLLTPSFSSAWMLRWGGVGHLRGTASDGRSLLLADPIPRDALKPLHRIQQYRFLLGLPADAPAALPELEAPEPVRARWRKELGVPLPRPCVALFPGANAPARRWPTDRFRALAEQLVAAGARVWVLGGPSEISLTGRVAEGLAEVDDLGGRTDLTDLAAVLSLCDLLVTNDTGPMHLAAALGVPTVSLWGPSSPGEVAPPGGQQRRVEGPQLPCRPCFKNHCPRRGRGTVLNQAHEECMKLIDTRTVLEAVHQCLHGEVR